MSYFQNDNDVYDDDNNFNGMSTWRFPVLWGQGVQTDREVLANRPDKIIKNMKDNICPLIDVAVPSDWNVIQKESEKKLKYKN
jgi:hypothetical protein